MPQRRPLPSRPPVKRVTLEAMLKTEDSQPLEPVSRRDMLRGRPPH